MKGIVTVSCPQHQIRLMVGTSNMAAIDFTYAQQMRYPLFVDNIISS